MSSDERLISKKQRFQEDDEEPSPKHWLFFQQFLDEVESWREFKFVITTRSKANYIWYKYSNEPANKMAQSQAGTLFLTPASSEDMTAICEKAEALFDEDLFKFALPVVALGCYDNRSKIAKAITTYLTLQKATNHTVETLHTTKLSKTKPSEVISFIPELSYFQEHYPKLTALNLSKDDFMLWLYAQPERDMMGLHIGRAASLPQGGIMAGETEPVEHSYRNVLILKGQPYIGKEIPNTEPVLTPSGWVPNGSLKVNDYVIGTKGLPIKVLGVYPQGVKDIYEITFCDKTVVRCGLEHLWTVTYQKKGPNQVRQDFTATHTTEELIKLGTKRRFRIPNFEGLKEGSNELFNYAWQLGYAIGNGCFSGGQFAISCHVKDLDLVKKQFDSISKTEGRADIINNGARISYGWAQLPECFAELRAQGLNKSVPSLIKAGDLSTRLKFFMGYFDADGCKHKRLTNEFSCSSFSLFNELVEIARSCGHIITCAYNNDCRKVNASHRGSIRFNNVEYSLIKNPCLPVKTQFKHNYIQSIVKTNYNEESTCIAVDSEDHLYVTANYKLTHNTHFNNWLINGLEHCGLTTSVIHDLGRQFGHGQWVSSAWSYLDDTTETMISHFFNSSILKTVASNGLVNVEAKGVDHITVKAFTAPILLANNIDTRHLANCDEGNANRIKIVACKDLHGCVIEAKQLPITSPLYGIESVIPAQIYIHLANKAEVSQEVLAMYFIRLCLDYFESFSMQEMSEKINKISQELYASYTTNGMNILAKSAVLSYLLRNSLSKTQVQELQVKFSEAGNSAPFILDSLITLADLDSRLTYNSQGMIKALIKQHWLKTGKDSTHPWVTHRNYSTYFLTKLGTIAETQIENLSRKGRDSVPLEKVYQTIFSELRDVDGNPSVYSISRIQDAWRAALVLNFNYVVEVYNFIKSELVRLKKPELLQLYRDHRMFFGELFTEISKSDKSPIVEIPDDYFFTYEAPDPMALFNDPTIF